MFYVYLLISRRNSKSYVGFTSKEVFTRLEEHNNGCDKFTSENKPWELVYYETFHCKACAMGREKFLKSGVGNKIVKILIENL